MKTDMIKEQLNTIINTANQAIDVNETSINDPEKGYPFACGYSRSALQQIADDLQQLINQL